MGWYHVNRTGKGILLEKFDLLVMEKEIPEELLPSGEWLDKNLKNFPRALYDACGKGGKIAVIGATVNMPYIYQGAKYPQDMEEKDLKHILEDEWDKKSTYLSSLGILFCYKYGYPLGAFTSLSDYDDTWMLFCTLDYPPKEYNEALANLTEPKYEQQLNEFFSQLLGKTVKVELKMCEEYIKE